MTGSRTAYSAFGLTVWSALELPLVEASGPGARPVNLAPISRDALRREWSGARGEPTWGTLFPGGRQVTVERGVAGDQLIRYADRAVFRISAPGERISWLGDRGDASSLRFLLDTVLWWTALTRGLHLLHASAVELDGSVLAFMSVTGGGKTTLAGELLLRGARLFSDDVVALAAEGGLHAHPGPPLMNVAPGRRDLRRLGRELARLVEGEEEIWLRVDDVSQRPKPLAAIFLYRRAEGLRLEAKRHRANVLDLVPFAWGLPDDEEAARARFTVMSDISGSVPAFVLTAGLDASATEIADAALTALAVH